MPRYLLRGDLAREVHAMSGQHTDAALELLESSEDVLLGSAHEGECMRDAQDPHGGCDVCFDTRGRRKERFRKAVAAARAERDSQ